MKIRTKTDTIQAITPYLPSHPALSELLVSFHRAYANLDFRRAADAVDAALAEFPVGTYRYFVAHEGSKWFRVLNETGRLAEMVNKLDGFFSKYPDMNLASEDTPEAVATMHNLRSQKISQGLPSALLITQKKSASVTLGGEFSEGFGLPCYTYALIFGQVIPSWARDYARGGASYVTHLMPTKINIAALKAAGLSKPIVHVRDPRQTLLSWVHHITTYASDFPEHIANGYKDWKMDARIDAVFSDYFSTVAWIEGWLEATKDLDVLFSTFEEFKQNPQIVVQHYLEHYGGNPAFFDASRVFVENDSTDYHRRKGEVDEWREVMNPRQIARMNAALPLHVLERFGWEL